MAKSRQLGRQLLALLEGARAEVLPKAPTPEAEQQLLESMKKTVAQAREAVLHCEEVLSSAQQDLEESSRRSSGPGAASLESRGSSSGKAAGAAVGGVLSTGTTPVGIVPGKNANNYSPTNSLSLGSSARGSSSRPFAGREVEEVFAQIGVLPNCEDCGRADSTVSWASLTHGVRLCIGCAGKHRGLGVTVSFVRSTSMDHWHADELIRMTIAGLAIFKERCPLWKKRAAAPANGSSSYGGELQLGGSFEGASDDEAIPDEMAPAPGAQTAAEQLRLLYTSDAAQRRRRHLDRLQQTLCRREKESGSSAEDLGSFSAASWEKRVSAARELCGEYFAELENDSGAAGGSGEKIQGTNEEGGNHVPLRGGGVRDHSYWDRVEEELRELEGGVVE